MVYSQKKKKSYFFSHGSGPVTSGYHSLFEAVLYAYWIQINQIKSDKKLNNQFEEADFIKLINRSLFFVHFLVPRLYVQIYLNGLYSELFFGESK